MRKTLDVLGVKYTVKRVNAENDSYISEWQLFGYCDSLLKQIVIADLHTIPSWADESDERIAIQEAITLRHEICHAFLHESGLRASTVSNVPWAENEEMVDWIANLFPRLLKAYEQMGCL